MVRGRGEGKGGGLEDHVGGGGGEGDGSGGWVFHSNGQLGGGDTSEEVGECIGNIEGS